MSAESNALATGLQKLIGSGGELPSSQLTAAQASAVQYFADRTGAVRRILKGNGHVYVITAADVVQLKFRELRPISLEEAPAELPARARNIATRRNSKAGTRRHALYHLLLRPVGAGGHWRHDDGRCLDVAVAGATSGLAAIAVSSNDSWCTDGPLWLVENQLLFDDLSWLPAGAAGTIAYYGGILDGRLLSWLTARRRHAGLTLFADYDGVGLHQYARLAATRNNKDVTFWLMPGWEQLLSDFGSTKVWANTFQNFQIATERLKGTAARYRVAELIAAMQRHGLALEQEAVWLAHHTGKMRYRDGLSG